MKSIIIFFIMLSSVGFSFLNLENICGIMLPRGGDENWGEGGFFVAENDTVIIKVYEDLNGTEFGTIQKRGYSLALLDDKSKGIQIAFGDIEWVGHYSNELIKSKSTSNKNYVNVFWKSKKGGLYLKKEDLQCFGLEYFEYKDLLFEKALPQNILRIKKWTNLGVNLNKNCLNLRKLPSINSKKIMCIPGNDREDGRHSHLTILETKNDWAKIELTTYEYDADSDESGEGCTFFERSKNIGWVRAIDKNGFPNIWFSVTSY